MQEHMIKIKNMIERKHQNEITLIDEDSNTQKVVVQRMLALTLIQDLLQAVL